MTETIHFYDKALGVPADADVFIAVCGDDVALVFGKEKGSEDGGVTEDECAVGWIFMRREGVAFLFFREGRVFEWVAEWV